MNGYDEKWLQRLNTHLKPLIRNQVIDVWSDKRIMPGTKWREEIERALARAKVAVLLVSPDFLASDFIAHHELPQLFKAAERDGTAILWVPVRPSNYGDTELSEYQALLDPSKPLSKKHHAHVDDALVEIAKQIKEKFQS